MTSPTEYPYFANFVANSTITDMLLLMIAIAALIGVGAIAIVRFRSPRLLPLVRVFATSAFYLIVIALALTKAARLW